MPTSSGSSGSAAPARAGRTGRCAALVAALGVWAAVLWHRLGRGPARGQPLRGGRPAGLAGVLAAPLRLDRAAGPAAWSSCSAAGCRARARPGSSCSAGSSSAGWSCRRTGCCPTAATSSCCGRRTSTCWPRSPPCWRVEQRRRAGAWLALAGRAWQRPGPAGRHADPSRSESRSTIMPRRRPRRPRGSRRRRMSFGAAFTPSAPAEDGQPGSAGGAEVDPQGVERGGRGQVEVVAPAGRRSRGWR